MFSAVTNSAHFVLYNTSDSGKISIANISSVIKKDVNEEEAQLRY